MWTCWCGCPFCLIVCWPSSPSYPCVYALNSAHHLGPSQRPTWASCAAALRRSALNVSDGHNLATSTVGHLTPAFVNVGACYAGGCRHSLRQRRHSRGRLALPATWITFFPKSESGGRPKTRGAIVDAIINSITLSGGPPRAWKVSGKSGAITPPHAPPTALSCHASSSIEYESSYPWPFNHT